MKAYKHVYYEGDDYEQDILNGKKKIIKEIAENGLLRIYNCSQSIHNS